MPPVERGHRKLAANRAHSVIARGQVTARVFQSEKWRDRNKGRPGEWSERGPVGRIGHCFELVRGNTPPKHASRLSKVKKNKMVNGLAVRTGEYRANVAACKALFNTIPQVCAILWPCNALHRLQGTHTRD